MNEFEADKIMDARLRKYLPALKNLNKNDLIEHIVKIINASAKIEDPEIDEIKQIADKFIGERPRGDTINVAIVLELLAKIKGPRTLSIDNYQDLTINENISMRIRISIGAIRTTEVTRYKKDLESSPKIQCAILAAPFSFISHHRKPFELETLDTQSIIYISCATKEDIIWGTVMAGLVIRNSAKKDFAEYYEKLIDIYENYSYAKSIIAENQELLDKLKEKIHQHQLLSSNYIYELKNVLDKL